MDRKLDGIYFRVLRDGKWGNACFSDLSQEEMDSRLKQMREIIRKQYILKLCFKRSMGELKGK